jgi:hypothetical protein
MRTLFEDTDERADREEAQEGRWLPLLLWLLAALLVAGAGGVYYWVAHRQGPEPLPVAVSLEDPFQRSEALNRFNGFVKAGKWDQAEQMLSAEARARLSAEKKTLRESLLAEHKDEQVVEALLTESISPTPSTVRVDCVYLFANKPQKIVPLTLVKENDRLVINSW